LLKDIAFVNLVKQVILDLKKQYAVPIYNKDRIHLIDDEDLTLIIDDQLFFEMILLELRGKCISHASYKKKENAKLETEIIVDIKLLEENLNENNVYLLEQKRQQLFEIRQKKVDGMIIRSRAKWLGDGEKNSKYFCNLEKRNFVQKAMCFIQKDNGETIHDSKSITSEAKSFYETLYASKETDILDEAIDTNLEHPTLTNEERDSLEGLITLQELLVAVKNLNNDKSPGSDGYTAEFFKFFFKDVGVFLLRSINHGFEKGEMSVTQKQGVITCIPKEGKDKSFLKNWRPITLLNIPYKIASSCIAQRLKSVLPKLIHEDQKGFLKGRFIGENIRLLYDTLLYSNKHNVRGLLLMVDFEKAFDSVAWSFIKKSLIKFNFGSSVTRWISTFYCNIKSCMSVNGQYSDWFHVQRGTRQGDPLSPYLFLICAEIMSIMIRQSNSVHGIKIADEEILLSQFADDTTFFLDGTRDCFYSCVRILQRFASMSGLQLNYDKSTAVWLGPLRNSRTRFMPELKFAWNPVTFKVLGIIFCTNMNEIVLLNYENKLVQMRKLLNSWSRRHLTPFGKITVLKTLALSKLTHLFMNLPDPNEAFLEDLSKLFFSFLWDGKRDRIKRTSMFQVYETGGLKMVDVKSFLAALKITWLTRILSNDGKITKILHALCPSVKVIKERGGEFANILMLRANNCFWVDVFKHYKRFCYKCVPASFNDFAAEPLHYNINICRDRNVIYIRNWIENGIVSVGHLLGPKGYLSYDQFKMRYPGAIVNFMLYEGIVRSVKNYQAKLELELEENFHTNEAYVWKCMSGGCAKHIYVYLVKSDVPLRCIEKWSHALNMHIDTRTVFRHIIKTTQDTHLRWFQFRLIYRILPSQRLLFLMKIVNSATCTFCEVEEGTLEHLFWDCIKTQVFWSNWIDWLHTNFPHCSNLRLSKEFVIFGCESNLHTDRIIDLFILLAKYHIFQAKTNNSAPLIQVFLRTVKQRFAVEKYNAVMNINTFDFRREWTLYNHFFCPE
jgi:hypothetical protein